jgi:hypothetical protein
MIHLCMGIIPFLHESLRSKQLLEVSTWSQYGLSSSAAPVSSPSSSIDGPMSSPSSIHVSSSLTLLKQVYLFVRNKCINSKH